MSDTCTLNFIQDNNLYQTSLSDTLVITCMYNTEKKFLVKFLYVFWTKFFLVVKTLLQLYVFDIQEKTSIII